MRNRYCNVEVPSSADKAIVCDAAQPRYFEVAVRGRCVPYVCVSGKFLAMGSYASSIRLEASLRICLWQFVNIDRFSKQRDDEMRS